MRLAWLRHHCNDSRTVKNSYLEILHQLLEQPENLFC